MSLAAEHIELLKLVDDRTKSIIFGFVHDTENACNLLHNIPLPIIQIIILFYHLIEYFDQHTNCIEICGRHQHIIKRNDNLEAGFNNSTFGGICIPSNSSVIVRWTFQMLQNHHYQNGLALGIISSNVNMEDAALCYKNKYIASYYYVSSGCCFENGKRSKTYGVELGKIGCRPAMELNLKTAQLIFYKDSKDLGVACCNIKKDDSIHYKLAVTLYWPDAQIKLVKFEYLIG